MNGAKNGTVEIKYELFCHETIKFYCDYIYMINPENMTLLEILDLIRFVEYEGKSGT